MSSLTINETDAFGDIGNVTFRRPERITTTTDSTATFSTTVATESISTAEAISVTFSNVSQVPEITSTIPSEPLSTTSPTTPSVVPTPATRPSNEPTVTPSMNTQPPMETAIAGPQATLPLVIPPRIPLPPTNPAEQTAALISDPSAPTLPNPNSDSRDTNFAPPVPNTNSNPTDASNSITPGNEGGAGGGVSSALVPAIVVSALVVVLLTVASVFVVARRRRNRQNPSSPSSSSNSLGALRFFNGLRRRRSSGSGSVERGERKRGTETPSREMMKRSAMPVSLMPEKKRGRGYHNNETYKSGRSENNTLTLHGEGPSIPETSYTNNTRPHPHPSQPSTVSEFFTPPPTAYFHLPPPPTHTPLQTYQLPPLSLSYHPTQIQQEEPSLFTPSEALEIAQHYRTLLRQTPPPPESTMQRKQQHDSLYTLPDVSSHPASFRDSSSTIASSAVFQSQNASLKRHALQPPLKTRMGEGSKLKRETMGSPSTTISNYKREEEEDEEEELEDESKSGSPYTDSSSATTTTPVSAGAGGLHRRGYAGGDEESKRESDGDLLASLKRREAEMKRNVF
ncbi:hypothetical protein HDV05_007347 [Chytridiales sp. JEL 0842]|nr:hypothetical protein HDV05_007347 [Chytridiales sp. JEL 0842]